ncbi:ABC transporter ATP-binding protein [Azospirillum sp. SYSU D00513]|uniref:ABC transporter ATP-binding protein n=1 Tax=Azospirillum sp. SYSU D00513 TaxID=2812561 RepID=UPI001A957874|nr:ABC transporter ATP-binding protein [Azospirillum sp. SYSU D00513]
MSPAALSTEGLSVSFGALQATRDVTFDLPAGARHALIGPNGAGKTTLINLLTGMLRPTAGRIRLHGEDVTALPPTERVRRGLVRTFQINTLFPALTPLESVVLAIAERRGLTRSWLTRLGRRGDVIEEAMALLRRLGLEADAERPTRELAYGRQRLVEIALALACEPRVLLLDEPAAGVPARESAELFDVISGLPRDLAILFIEHDMELVFRFAERITVLVSGQVLCHGTPAEIADDSRVREVYLGSAAHV